MHRLCVFCGSKVGASPTYAVAMDALGSAMIQRQIGLVYGGGSIGLMGRIADQIMASGGDVYGVIPQDMADHEVAHQGVSRLDVVDGMHARKTLMYAAADAFVAAPGGIGTFEEFFETFTWRTLGYHDKPIGILNVDGYFDPLVALLDASVDQGFLSSKKRALVIVDTEAERLVDRLVPN